MVVLRTKTDQKAKAVLASVCAGFVALGVGLGLIFGGVFGLISVQTAAVQGEKLPVFSVERGDKRVAITFDMAWEGYPIQKLLDILQAYDVKATFFVVGEYAEQFPDEIKALAAAGHEVENHSYHHLHVATASADAIIADLDKCSALLKQLTGRVPMLYRSPYGEFNEKVTKTLQAAGLVPVQWSVDSIDWKDPAPEKIKERILEKVKAGDILLFHTAKENTLNALPDILKGLKEKGLAPVPAGQLIYKENYRIDQFGRQFANQQG